MAQFLQKIPGKRDAENEAAMMVLLIGLAGLVSFLFAWFIIAVGSRADADMKSLARRAGRERLNQLQGRNLCSK